MLPTARHIEGMTSGRRDLPPADCGKSGGLDTLLMVGTVGYMAGMKNQDLCCLNHS